MARTACADVVAAEWRWLPRSEPDGPPRGSHLASCVGRRTERSTYTASFRRATEPRLCEREARGVGRATARRDSGAFHLFVFERSELMLTLPAKMGEGGRVGALSGAERAPLPPPFSAKR